MPKNVTASKTLLDAIDLQAMGIARTMSYNLFHRDDFPTIQIGNRLFVRAVKFEEWCENMEREGKPIV